MVLPQIYSYRSCFYDFVDLSKIGSFFVSYLTTIFICIDVITSTLYHYLK